MSIDWSKAPEGAQAAYPGCDQLYPAWYRLDRHGYVEQICEGAGCDTWTGMGGRKDFPVGHILRPTITTKEKLESLTQQDWEMIGLKATVAQQAQMIEHLRGGPTPGYTAVDMTTAAAQGFRDGVASRDAEIEALRKELAARHPFKPAQDGPAIGFTGCVICGAFTDHGGLQCPKMRAYSFCDSKED